MSAEPNTRYGVPIWDHKDAWTQVFDERFDKHTCDGLSFEDAETRAQIDANDATDDGLADYLHDQWKDREYG
ncbi:MAG: hypothetical protein H8E94_01235 [Alphaproteobacteria bacterium]|nr:hypothetical protein [Alphaproteobacteria bacterium]